MIEETKETKAERKRGQDLVDMVNSPGWAMAKKKFIAKIMELQSVMNLDTDAENLIVDAKARVMAIETLKDFINEIDGDVEMFIQNYEKGDEEYTLNEDW